MDQFCTEFAKRWGGTDAWKRSIDMLIDDFDKRNKVRKEQLNFHGYYSCEMK
jgi:hypothetical protein